MRRLALALAFCLIAAHAGAARAEAADKLTFMLDWFVNPDHGPVVIAKEKGFFAAQNLDVTLIQPADPNDGPKLAAAKKADIALDYQPQLQLQVDAGLPLVRIGTMVGTPLNIILAKADGPIHGIKDLKGKRIGYSVSGFEDSILDTVLGQAGISRDDVTLINVNFNLVPALLSGQVDAVVGAYRTYELLQMAQEGQPGFAIYPEEHGVPVYDEMTFVTHKDNLGRPEMKRFLTAVQNATLWIKNHPDEAWDVFRKSHKEADDALNAKSWAVTYQRFTEAPAALDWGRYENFEQFLKAHGLIKKITPVQDYAVDLWAPR